MTNTGKIERAAVRAVEEYLDQCPKLEVYIDSNDKTPIWDGDVYIYKNKEQKNENFFARVPLVVKGTINGEDSFYRISREYIKGFKSDRGCVFFLVQVSENYPKVLYAILSSKVLDFMLKRSSKTINIDLQEVPSNPLDFEKELYEFAAYRNKEKVENTSPKEIQELVKGFEEIREHLKEIEDKSVRAKLKTHLDTIKNLSEDTQDDDTIGWRDIFYYCSREAIDLAINNIKDFDFTDFQFKLGKYLQDQKQYHLAEDYYLKLLMGCRKRAEAIPISWFKSDVARILNILAALHDDLTHYNEAEKEYYEALKIRHELAETDPDSYIADVAMTLNNLGNLHRALSRYDEAEKEYYKALEIYRELAKTNRDAYIGDVAMTLNNLGNLHSNLNRYNEAENEYNEALEIRRELAKTDPDAYIGDLAKTLNNLAVLHQNLTRYSEAEKEYKDALEIYRELAKTNRDAYIEYEAGMLNNLGSLHSDLSRYDEAEKEYNKALEIYRELAETNRDAYIGDVAMTLYNLALQHKYTNNKEKAKEATEEALDIFKKLAETYPQVWNRYLDKTKRLNKLLKN